MKSGHPGTEGSIRGEQSLVAVGNWLKNAREQKGETLDDASKITRIGKNYLEALEEGATGKLPSQAYTRGFVRLYASHLGLSPDEAVSMMASQTADTGSPDQRETLATPARPLPHDRQPGRSRRTVKLLSAIICVVALASIIISLIRNNNRLTSSPENRIVAPSTAPAVPVSPAAEKGQLPAKPAAPPAAVAVPGSSSESPGDESIVLRLKAIRNGRLHITIDGSVSQEYDLVTGDLVEWKAEKMFLLDLENAGSVEGELDGSPLKPFGVDGKAAHLIIRRNGIQNN